MGIELGSVLSGIGNAAGSLGRACTGIAERGGAAAPSMAGGLFRAGLDFRGPQLSILSAPVIKEGPVSISDLKNSAKVQTSAINPLGEIRFSPEPQIPEAPSEPVFADPADVLAEAEAILKDARVQAEENQLYAEPVKENLKPFVQEPDIQPVHPVVNAEGVPQPAKTILFPQKSVAPEAARIMQLRRLIEIEKRVNSKPAVSVSAQPALDEEEVLEEVADQRPASKQIDIVEEASESMFLKEVVDEPVLKKRTGEFGEAIERAYFEAEMISAEEEEKVIDGSRVAELAGPETKNNRSGLVKDHGPDGSRVEVLEEVKGKKYKSRKQAKDEIFAAIFQKPPVKRATQGKEAGREAVMRVLKFLLVRYLAPAKQEAVKIFKKRTIQKTGLSAKSPEVPKPPDFLQD